MNILQQQEPEVNLNESTSSNDSNPPVNNDNNNEEQLPSFQTNVLEAYRNRLYQKCITLIERKLRREPNEAYHHYRILLAASYTMLGTDFRKAHNILDQVLHESPLNYYALYGKGVAYYFEKKIPECIDMMDQAIAVGGDGSARASNFKTKVLFHNRRAVVLIEKLNIDRIRSDREDSEIFELSEDEDPNDITLNDDESEFGDNDNDDDVFLNERIIFNKQDLIDRAQNLNSEAKELFLKALEHYHNGKMREAMESFNAVHTLEPSFVEAEGLKDKASELIDLIEIGESNLEGNKFEAVIVIANQAFEIEDKVDAINKAFHYMRGMAYFKMNKFAKSKKDYDQYDMLCKKLAIQEAEQEEEEERAKNSASAATSSENQVKEEETIKMEEDDKENEESNEVRL
jgi:tetratricopeptide (TPR) repeat protein